MTDKILGIKKSLLIEMLENHYGRLEEQELTEQTEEILKEYESNLVPVVSVKEIQDKILEIKDNGIIEHCGTCKDVVDIGILFLLIRFHLYCSNIRLLSG